MRLPFEHTRGYHEWESTTPLVDALGAVVGMISIVIGGHAAISLALAVRDRDNSAIFQSVLFFVAIALANGFVDVLRRWRRHHY
jgi:hypothetical protein